MADLSFICVKNARNTDANQERKRQTSLKDFVFGGSDLIVFAYPKLTDEVQPYVNTSSLVILKD
jgi:hypothetical protein